MGLENMAARMRRQDIIFSASSSRRRKTAKDIFSEGVLEILQDGFGFLRSADGSYLPGPDDIYVSPSQIRRFNLRTGDTISGKIRPPKDGERYFALLKVDEINFDVPENAQAQGAVRKPDAAVPERAPQAGARQRQHRGPDRAHHRPGCADRQGPARPDRLAAEGRQDDAAAEHRALHRANHPECYLIVLLIDERPEEVTEMERSVQGRGGLASTFDEPASRHVQVAEMVIEKAKRLVEHKRDVVILLDSITRLARAYNTVVPSSGKVLSGGVDANALHPRSASSAPRATSRKAAA